MPTAGARRRLWGVDVSLPCNSARRVLEASTYDDIEWVVVHGEASDAMTRHEIRLICGTSLIEVEQAPEFNFSDAVNRGVLASSGEVVVLLNDDVEVLTPDWLEQFIAALDDDRIGSVGPRLLFPNFRIQSAGHWHGETPEHLGRGCDRTDPGPFSALQIARECSSLTAACIATRRSTWDLVGGMTTELPNAYNDADFGNKLRSIGLENLWLPSVEAIHHETSTRNPEVSHQELRIFHRRWSSSYRNDCFSPNGLW